MSWLSKKLSGGVKRLSQGVQKFATVEMMKKGITNPHLLTRDVTMDTGIGQFQVAKGIEQPDAPPAQQPVPQQPVPQQPTTQAPAQQMGQAGSLQYGQQFGYGAQPYGKQQQFGYGGSQQPRTSGLQEQQAQTSSLQYGQPGTGYGQQFGYRSMPIWY